MSNTVLIFAVMLRWLDILGVLLFVGALSLRQLTVLPTIQSLKNQKTASEMLAEEDPRLGCFLQKILFYLLGLQALNFAFQVGLKGESPFLSTQTIPEFLLETRFGQLWIFKVLLLLSLMALSFSSKWKPKRLLVGGSLLCLLGSLSGHAVAPGIHYIFLTDWLHYSAVSVWAGGLVPLRGIARRSRQWMSGEEHGYFLSSIVETFSVWAMLCVITIVITGSFNAMIYLGLRGFSVDLEYAKILLLKLFFVLATFGLGGFSRIYILPRLQKCSAFSTSEIALLERLFYRAITIETGLVLAALALASLLTQTSPPQLQP